MANIGTINGVGIGDIAEVGGASVSTYEIYDTWTDNLLTSRTDTYGITVNDIPESSAPEWATDSGAPEAVGGVLDLQDAATSNAVTTPTTFFIGTWDMDVNLNAAGGNFYFLLGTTGAYWQSKYELQWFTDNTYDLYDRVGGHSPIAAAAAPDGSAHDVKITRDSGSNWEIFFDGGSKGTATDNTSTTITQIGAYCTGNANSATVDNLAVFE